MEVIKWSANKMPKSGDQQLSVMALDEVQRARRFHQSFPQYAVSIALKRENEVIEAVVADPVANEVFTATRGVGAFVNGRRLRVSKRSQMAEALVGTGFPFRRTGV